LNNFACPGAERDPSLYKDINNVCDCKVFQILSTF
jgi:hypothetical protein